MRAIADKAPTLTKLLRNGGELLRWSSPLWSLPATCLWWDAYFGQVPLDNDAPPFCIDAAEQRASTLSGDATGQRASTVCIS